MHTTCTFRMVHTKAVNLCIRYMYMALPLSSCEWMHISRRYKKLLELPPWFMCYSLNRLLNKQFDRRELYYITQYKTTRAIGMYVWLHNMMFLNRPITSHSIKYFNRGFYHYASHFFFFALNSAIPHEERSRSTKAKWYSTQSVSGHGPCIAIDKRDWGTLERCTVLHVLYSTGTRRSTVCRVAG